MTTRYNSIIPENNKSDYGEYDIIDFVVDYNGQRVLGNTFRISGELQVLKNNVLIDTEDVRLDSMCGIHNLFQQVSVELGSIGLVENITNYGRSVKMMMDAQYNKLDTLNAIHSAEMKAPTDRFSGILLREQKVGDMCQGSIYKKNADFSVAPVFCLNRVFDQSGGDDVSMTYGKYGNIKVSLQCNRVVSLIYGRDVDSSYTYKLFNPRLEFQSVLDTGAPQSPLVVKVKNSLRSVLNSSLSTISVKAPMICDSISMSFISQAEENVYTVNALKQAQIPNVSELVVSYNNLLNQLTTYSIRDKVQMLVMYLKALGSNDNSNVSLTNLSGNKGYGLGYKLDQPIDLSKNQVQFQLTSDINSSQPFVSYVMMEGFLSI